MTDTCEKICSVYFYISKGEREMRKIFNFFFKKKGKRKGKKVEESRF